MTRSARDRRASWTVEADADASEAGAVGFSGRGLSHGRIRCISPTQKFISRVAFHVLCRYRWENRGMFASTLQILSIRLKWEEMHKRRSSLKREKEVYVDLGN